MLRNNYYSSIVILNSILLSLRTEKTQDLFLNFTFKRYLQSVLSTSSRRFSDIVYVF